MSTAIDRAPSDESPERHADLCGAPLRKAQQGVVEIHRRLHK
jgi:hypothetical protein